MSVGDLVKACWSDKNIYKILELYDSNNVCNALVLDITKEDIFENRIYCNTVSLTPINDNSNLGITIQLTLF